MIIFSWLFFGAIAGVVFVYMEQKYVLTAPTLTNKRVLKAIMWGAILGWLTIITVIGCIVIELISFLYKKFNVGEWLDREAKFAPQVEKISPEDDPYNWAP